MEREGELQTFLTKINSVELTHKHRITPVLATALQSLCQGLATLLDIWIWTDHCVTFPINKKKMGINAGDYLQGLSNVNVGMFINVLLQRALQWCSRQK